jgi:hypothetical protein
MEMKEDFIGNMCVCCGGDPVFGEGGRININACPAMHMRIFDAWHQSLGYKG